MQDWTLIIVGATGDLAKHKLLPAIEQLKKNKNFRFLIIGAARDAFYNLPYNLEYYQLDLTKPEQFQDFSNFIEQQEKKHNISGNRLLYCSVAADFFAQLTENSVSSGIIRENTQDKIVYEKPFGWSLESARAINKTITQFLSEQQIYRIDHYLLKDLVSSIVLLRFNNLIFEPVWNNKYIDQVQIIMAESIDIKNRGAFYDKYGLLKDVVQNHLLQLVALVAMEKPESLENNTFQRAKKEVLEQVAITDALLGQYENYIHETGVNLNSKTETFAALKLDVKTERWKNTPFYIIAGKCFAQKRTEIRIVFKQTKEFQCAQPNICSRNILTINIGPQEGFKLQINVKEPRSINKLLPISLDFCYDCLLGPESNQAYYLLLEEILHNIQSIKVSFAEIEASWNIIEKFILNNKCEPVLYTCGKYGPSQLHEFIKKYNIILTID